MTDNKQNIMKIGQWIIDDSQITMNQWKTEITKQLTEENYKNINEICENIMNGLWIDDSDSDK